jgi:hypothetical protein
MKKLIVGLSMASLLGCAAQQQSAAPSPAREPVATVQPAAQAERHRKTGHRCGGYRLQRFIRTQFG